MTAAKTPFVDTAVEILPEKGEGRIILCDCNGTLFDPVGQQGFNRALFDFLKGAEERGYAVHLHSGDANGNMDTYVPVFSLRNKDFREFIARHDEHEMGAILPKGYINTKDAFLTIDDQHGGEFKSAARHQWSPLDPRMTATVQAWASGATATPVAAPPAAVPSGTKPRTLQL